MLEELGKAFGNGTGDSLQKLVDDGDVLTQAALDALPETKTLICDGTTVLNTQRDVAGQFESFNRDLGLLTTTLRDSDGDFRSLFANGTQSANELTDLILRNRSDLPVLLSNLTTVAQVQKVRLPALQQILVTYPNVVAGGFTVAPGDGTTHFGLVTNSTPPVCTAGYETTDRRPPSDTATRTPNLEAFCAEPEGSPSNIRGAQNSPYAPGSAAFPEGRDGSTTTASGSRLPGSSAPREDSIAMADYDPANGRVITADGDRLSIGSSFGADRVFGADSWRWLLLGPLSR